MNKKNSAISKWILSILKFPLNVTFPDYLPCQAPPSKLHYPPTESIRHLLGNANATGGLKTLNLMSRLQWDTCSSHSSVIQPQNTEIDVVFWGYITCTFPFRLQVI